MLVNSYLFTTLSADAKLVDNIICYRSIVLITYLPRCFTSVYVRKIYRIIK